MAYKYPDDARILSLTTSSQLAGAIWPLLNSASAACKVSYEDLLAAISEGFAPDDHNHDGDYAPLVHSHSEYALEVDLQAHIDDEEAHGGGGSGSPELCALLGDSRTVGTHGGSSSAGVWMVRDLNTIFSDPDDIVSLAGNQITLQPGFYRIRASSPAYVSLGHRIRLYDVTAGAPLLIGSSSFSHSHPATSMTRSFLIGAFEITSATIYEIQHRVEYACAVYGLGRAAGFGGDEIYTLCEIRMEV